MMHNNKATTKWQSVVRIMLLQLFLLATLKGASSKSVETETWVLRAPGSTRMPSPLETLLKSQDARVMQPQVYNFHVVSDISYRYATTTVSSKIANPANNFSQEVSFNALLPETAFVSGLVMDIEGKLYEATVKEKNKAEAEYSEAVRKGAAAAHAQFSARDSKMFRVSVNVGPGQKVVFNLTYEELLVRKLSAYTHVININPGKIVRELSVIVHIQESADIADLQVAPLRMSNEIPSRHEDVVNPLATIERPTSRSAVIRWEPTPTEQSEIDFDGVKGQFVIRYDVDRSSNPSQILVGEDGYLVYFFAPENLPPLRKHVTFMLDTSGSMDGPKMDQLKEAMHTILSDLNPGDFFSILTFATHIKVWSAWPGKWLPVLRNKGVVIPVSRENISKAKQAINSLAAGEETNIHKALKKGLQLSKMSKKVWKSNDLGRQELAFLAKPNGSDTFGEAPLVGAGMRKSRHPEPMIIFITDGEPTLGNTDKERIVTITKRLNRRYKVSIFSLVLGEDADFEFLKKVSLLNNGFARRIYEATDTAQQLHEFYQQVSSPLLANVTFNYPFEEVESLTRRRFPTLYEGSELVLMGHLGDNQQGEDWYKYDVLARSAAGLVRFMAPEVVHGPSLERWWAFLSVQQLLESSSTAALRLALKYSLVTPLTSLVVTKPGGRRSLAIIERGDLVTPGATSDEEHIHSWVTGGLEDDLVGYGPDALPYDALGEERRRGYVGGGSAHSLGTEEAVKEETERAHGVRLVRVGALQWLRNASVVLLLPIGPGGTIEPLQVADPSISQMLLESFGTRIARWSTVISLENRHILQNPDTMTPCLTPNLQVGSCRHLTHCPLNVFKNHLEDYLRYFCKVGFSFAGVCCPSYVIPVDRAGSVRST